MLKNIFCIVRQKTKQSFVFSDFLLGKFMSVMFTNDMLDLKNEVQAIFIWGGF